MKSPVKCPNQAISGLQLCRTWFPPLRLTGKGVPGRTSYYWAPLYPVSDLAISDSHMAKSDLVPPPETCWWGETGRTSYYWVPLYPISDLAISEAGIAKTEWFPPLETRS